MFCYVLYGICCWFCMYNVIIYKLCYKWLLAYCFVLRHSYIIIYSKFDVYIYIPDISMSSIEVKYLSAIM